MEKNINKLYLEILGRPVDNHGLAHYKKLIESDKWTLDMIKNDLLSSSERRYYEIKLLYKKILYRDADDTGLQFYHNSTFSIDEIKHLLENSEEKNKDENDFIKSYANYYKHFPISLSNNEYNKSIDTLNTINQFYLDSFGRSLTNVSKFYYQLLSIKNSKLVNSDMTSYKLRVEQGKNYMRDNTIVICGLLRDKDSIIKSLKFRCYEITKLFSDYRILIVENDSHDNTRPLLLEWSKEDSKVLILGNGVNSNECHLNLPKTHLNKPADCTRIQKMSLLRNIYLDYLKENLNTFNYVAVLDMDLRGDLFIDSICESLYYLRNKNVDGITCNGMEKYFYHYYDSFAYIDLGSQYIWDTEKEKTDHDNYIFSHKTKQHTESMKVTKVLSAFGGFCIYRLSSIIKYSYNYSPNKFSCEHAHLNKHLKNFYINPRMVFAITEND
jgi:hypothetical protein